MTAFPLPWRRRGYVSLLHLSMIKKIPKVCLEKLIYVPGRNQPSMSRDIIRGENPGWEKVYKVSTTHPFPHPPSPKNTDGKTHQVKSSPCPFVCMILVEAETHTAKRKERDCCGEGRKLVVRNLLVQVLELSRSGEGKKLWLKHNYFITTHIQTYQW